MIRTYRYKYTIALLGGLSVACYHVQAREYFNPAFLGKDSDVDLSVFEDAGYIPPGRYIVDIYVNQNKVESRSLNFTEQNGKTVPELTLSQLNDWGINVKSVSSWLGKPLDTVVYGISTDIPQSSLKFDFQRLRLDISIPQESMKPSVRGVVDPALWDEGIPAFLMNYNINGAKGKYDSHSALNETQNLFATFRNGINMGPWRLRSTQTYTDNSTQYKNNYNTENPEQKKWRTSDTFLQRNIRALQGELTIGESTTGNDVFDGIPFRGVQLASDDAMLPDSMQGFAPVITGNANSNALVTVTQNGYVMYQTTVAPGPFRITDMYSSGNSGDLTITVKEADGSTHVTTQGYSSLSIMERPGGFKYEVTLGKYHGGNLTVGSRNPNFGMATLIYGLPHNVTLYGGGLVADNYQSAVIGTGVSLGSVGALSLDVTQARAQLPGTEAQPDTWNTGQSYRVRFSKDMMSTGTGIDLAAYRYSTKNYYSFSDVNSMGYQLNYGQVPWALDRRRSTLRVDLRQSLKDLGSIYLSAYKNDYWDSSRRDNNLSAGYNFMTKGISWGLSYTIDRIKQGDDYPENRQFMLTAQIPFSIFGPQRALQNLNASYTMTHDNNGQVTQSAGVNGSFLDNRLSWNAQQSWGNANQQDNSSVYLGYQGNAGSVNAGYSNSGMYKNYSYGASGAVLVHQHGVTLSRMLSDGAVLVRAPGVSGANVSSGVQTDWRGYAVVPSITPYRKNSVTIDPSSLPDGKDIEQTSQNLYPTRGAVVMADYKVRSGQQLMMTLLHNGKPLPFGALVSLIAGEVESSGIVGDGGQVYLSGMPAEGRIQAKWGNQTDQQCSSTYRVKTTDVSLTQLTADCQ